VNRLEFGHRHVPGSERVPGFLHCAEQSQAKED
jgi:hypothetical protein